MMSERQADSRLTVDDLLGLEQVGDAQLHPREPLVAYTVAALVTEHKQSKAASRIWLARTDGAAAPRPLTAEGTRAQSPRWSPDGSRLAFLGTRESRSDPDDSGVDADQLFQLDGSWGEARRLTDCPGGVSGFAWLPDGAGLLLLVVDAPPEDGHARHERGQDMHVYEQHHRFTRIWRYDLATEQLELLSRAGAQVYELAVSPDGRDIVALVADEPYGWAWYRARLALLGPDGTFQTIHTSRKQYTFPDWSPGGQQVAVITCTFSDQGMTGGDVLVMRRDGSDARLVTEGHPRSYLSAVWEADGERLFCAALEDGEAQLGYLTLDGAFDIRWRERKGIHGIYRAGGALRPDPRGILALGLATPTEPADVWTVDLSTPQLDWTRHTDHNPTIRERTLTPTETLHWRAPDGLTIQGLLVRPADHAGGPLPLIVQIHGGPTSLWSYDFPGARSMGWVQLLAAAGYAVLLPNPRGSMGFGTTYAEANIGDMGGRDWGDILAGVDYCIAHGIADPERLGVCGWSYGGYLTAWAVTQTDRFKAAVAGASITNWISFHGVSTIPDFDANFYQADPFGWDGHYGQFSPMAHVRNTRTPTLFLHGERDPICPLGQAHEMWRALKELGVTTELVVYPREGHGIREREHARDVLERAVGWLTRYV
jgi:dipeptidyl aminopeptidase/acylaminoacyl peptidase